MILLIGALLNQAEELIRMGLKPAEIIEGFELAKDKLLDDILPDLVCGEIKEIKNLDEAIKGIRTAVMSKQYGNEDFISCLIATACIAVMPKDPASSFNVDNVRVIKILGAGILKSYVVQGMLFKRNVNTKYK